MIEGALDAVRPAADAKGITLATAFGGLGLALVKSLVELHGGHVRAESAGRGKGAFFTVMLPLPTGRRPPPIRWARNGPGIAALPTRRKDLLDMLGMP